MIYALDTNVVVRILRGQTTTAKAKLAALGPDQVVIPEMVRAELLTGAAKSANPTKNLNLVGQILAPFRLLPFSGDAVEHYAKIRVHLERTGSIIGPNDLIIAATARAAGTTLVTGNTKEFKRVPSLRCIDWK